MVDMATAVSMSGRSKAAIRSLIRRGRLVATKSNTGRWLIRVEPWLLATRPDTWPDGHPEREHGHPELVEARMAQARAEGEAKALRDALTDLAGRLDRAETALAWHRQPWWRRLVGG
jgi:hypothetical protein